LKATKAESRRARVPLFAQGIEAARANIVPGIFLWMVAVGVVLSYYFLPQAQSFFQEVARLKSDYGYRFSFISTALFAGLIPFIVAVIRRTGATLGLSQVAFVVIFWGIKGMEFDTLYRVQVFFFGDSPAPGTVAAKVLVDQLVYCPLWAVPSMVLVYLWKDSDFSLSEMRRRLGRHWYRDRMAPVLVSNWALWVPAVTCIYLLPAPLQLPLQNLVICFWVLILMFMTSRAAAKQHEIADARAAPR
jgi:hypothetical protein